MHILDMMSFIKTPEALNDLNQVISNYFATKADAEMTAMWEKGILNEKQIENFRSLHERTPYNKTTLKELANEHSIRYE